jgi:hypothetical protein
MYVYLELRGGFNDILTSINKANDYCKKTNRTLLVNGKNTIYNVNFSDYFTFDDPNIICDSDLIENICKQNISVYPEILSNKMSNILNNKTRFDYNRNSLYYSYNNILLDFPDEDNNYNLIIIVTQGDGGYSYNIFKLLIFKPIIINECKRRYSLLKKPYLSIHIRNTDYKCDYKKYYEDNISLIKSFNEIYLATDDKQALNFYKENKLPIINFTTFPNNNWYCSLHTSNIESNIKFIDLFCDIYIVSLSKELLTNSKGGFIDLLRNCFDDKTKIIKQFS